MKDQGTNTEPEQEELGQEAEEALAIIEETLGRIASVKKRRPITDISKAVVILHEGFGMSQQDIANKFNGVSQPTISNYYSIRLRTTPHQDTGLIPDLYSRAEEGEMSLRAAIDASKLPPALQMRIYEESEESPRVTQAVTGEYAREHKAERRALAIGEVPIPDVETHPGRVFIHIRVPEDAATKLPFSGEVEFEFEGRDIKLTVEEMEVTVDESY